MQPYFSLGDFPRCCYNFRNELRNHLKNKSMQPRNIMGKASFLAVLRLWAKGRSTHAPPLPPIVCGVRSMYGKIFEEIFDSTIVAHGSNVVYVFMSMIVLSDKEGYLRITAPALAARIVMHLPDVESAIKILEKPDPNSNTPDFDGRRIVSISEITNGQERRGWVVVNKDKFREIGSLEDRKDQNKEAKRRQRMKDKLKIADMSSSVSIGQPRSAMSAHTDTDTNADTNINTLSSKTRREVVSFKKEALEVLNFLNQEANRSFRPVEANLAMITARLQSGATVPNCKGIIVRKCREWKGSPQEKYLRPETLFNKTKFESYLGERPGDLCNAQNAAQSSSDELAQTVEP